MCHRRQFGAMRMKNVRSGQTGCLLRPATASAGWTRWPPGPWLWESWSRKRTSATINRNHGRRETEPDVSAGAAGAAEPDVSAGAAGAAADGPRHRAHLRQLPAAGPAAGAAAAAQLAGGARRDAVHRDPPGLRAVVQAGAARAGAAGAGLRRRADRGGAGDVQAHPHHPEDAGCPGGRAGDNDPQSSSGRFDRGWNRPAGSSRSSSG